MNSPVAAASSSASVNSYFLPHDSCPTAKFGKALMTIVKDDSSLIYHLVGRIMVIGCGILMPLGSVAYHAGAAALKLPVTTFYVLTFWIPIRKDAETGKWQLFGDLYPNEAKLGHFAMHLAKVTISCLNIIVVTPVGLCDPQAAMWWLQLTFMLPRDKQTAASAGATAHQSSTQVASPPLPVSVGLGSQSTASDGSDDALPSGSQGQHTANDGGAAAPQSHDSGQSDPSAAIGNTSPPAPPQPPLPPPQQPPPPPPSPTPLSHSGCSMPLPGNLIDDLKKYNTTKKDVYGIDLDDNIQKARQANQPLMKQQSAVLQQIRAGVTLKHVKLDDVPAKPLLVPTLNPAQQTVASINAAINARRHLIEPVEVEDDDDDPNWV